MQRFRETAAWIAEKASRAFSEGSDRDAEASLVYLAAHQPEVLVPYLRSLWDARDHADDEDLLSWAWRAADDEEVARLTEIVQAGGADAEFAAGCLLQTRRPEVVAGLNVEPVYVEMVGLGREPDGSVTRLHPDVVWHAAFPEPVRTQLAKRNAYRPQWGSWPERSGSGSRHLISGFTNQACLVCGQRLHRLLRLDPVPEGIGITSRQRAEFTWCPQCTVYVPVWYARHAPDGTPGNVTTDPPAFRLSHKSESTEDWPVVPETAVGLVRLDDRWRRQEPAVTTDHENLHRVGGEPHWEQDPHYPSCPDCARRMRFAAQISVADLFDGEGTCYLMWCDPCSVSAVIFQQT